MAKRRKQHELPPRLRTLSLLASLLYITRDFVKLEVTWYELVQTAMLVNRDELTAFWN